MLLLSNGKLKKEVCHLQLFKYYTTPLDMLLLSKGKLKKEVCHLQPFKYYNGLINELSGKKQKLPKGLSKARLVKANKKGGGAIPDAAALAVEAAPKPSKKRKDLVRGTRHPLSYMWGKFNFILKV